MQYGKWVIAMVLMLAVKQSAACDLCSTYLGINPDDYKNSFGLINRIRVFESTFQHTTTGPYRFARTGHLGTTSDLASSEKTDVKEAFVSYDLWLKYFINQRWEINLSATFVDNTKYQDDSIINVVGGVGDMTAIVKFQVYNTKNAYDSVSWVHRLIVGGGIKVPTGSYNRRGMSDELDPHLQAGTGSTDFLILMEYLLKYKRTGINSNVSYKANAENKNEFRFANRFNSNVALFYIAGNKLKCMPSIGLSYESSERDRLSGERFLGSGGEVMFVTTGIKLFYKQLSVGTTYYTKPIHQDLYDKPLQLNNKHRVITELTYYF